MIDLEYSLTIEATKEPDFFGFYSHDLPGFSGIGHSVEAEANYIITGDIHLLKLGGCRDIKILNAVAFLEEISSGT